MSKFTMTITFQLREVTDANVNSIWSKELWLFGRTLDKKSVAVKIQGFRNYIYVDKPDLDHDLWRAEVNDIIRPFEKCEDSIYRTEHVSMDPGIGYSQTKIELLRVYLNDGCNIHKLRKFLDQQEYTVNSKMKKLTIYNDKHWGKETLFINENNLELQQWITVPDAVVPKFANPPTSRCTSADIELVGSVVVHAKEIKCSVIPMRICVVRIRAISEVSCEFMLMQANAQNQGDRIICISTESYWLGDTDTISKTYSDTCEKTLLENFHNDTTDVDVFFTCSDNCMPLAYISQRTSKHNIQMNISRFRSFSGELVNNYTGLVNQPGRSRIDLKAALPKMQVKPELEAFTLKVAAFHPKILETPPHKEFEGFSFMDSKNLSLSENIRQCEEEVKLMKDIEMSNNITIGFIEKSMSTFVPITNTVENGQQIRVMSKFCNTWHKLGWVANLKILDKPPLVIKMKRSETSFPNPPDFPNKQCSKRGKWKDQQNKPAMNKKRTLFGKVIDTKKKKKKKTQRTGGYVQEPIPGFYSQLDEATFTLDFASLYPSIIQGYNICYKRLIFDKSILDDPRATFDYIPITDTDALVLISHYDGIPVPTFLPQAEAEATMLRKAVKKLMKNPNLTTFEYNSLNAKQLACKVFQNAVYGFLGVLKNAYCAAPVLMQTVCAIGQYMIKTVQYACKTKFGAFVVYGDTDSVMVQFPCPDHLTEKNEIFDYFYSVAVECCKHCSTLFPSPNKLESEGMKWPFLLHKKKNYTCLQYDEDDWRKGSKHIIKGRPWKKRDKCPWVRNIGKQLDTYIHNSENDKIIPFLEQSLSNLVNEKVPIKDLSISCLMKRPEEYKSDNLIQKITAEKIADRSGKPVDPGSRLSYVVIQGNQPHAELGEDPLFVTQNNIPLDLIYYLTSQLLNCIQGSLEFHPKQQKEFISMNDRYVRILSHRKTGARTLMSMSTSCNPSMRTSCKQRKRLT